MSEKQTDRLLAHLRTHGKINPLDAWQQLGIYRLGARVYDLRQAGHAIEKKTVEVRNRFGEPCRVAEYRLEVAP